MLRTLLQMQSRKTSADLWHQKPYYSLDAWCKNTYGRKLYKAALDIGCTCPNRDGTLNTRGCIFCSAGGSGDFAASRQLSVTDQLNQAKALLSSKWTPEPGKPSLIAYFQAYTNTYGDPDRLLSCYEEALSSPEVAGISIATRPDCLSDIILLFDLLLFRVLIVYFKRRFTFAAAISTRSAGQQNRQQDSKYFFHY